jgi:hypothetical protein
MGLIEDVCRCVEQLIRSGYLAEAICEDLALIVRAARSGTALAIIAPMARPGVLVDGAFPLRFWGGGPRQVGAQPFLVVVP